MRFASAQIIIIESAGQGSMFERHPVDTFPIQTNRFHRFCRFLTKVYHNYNHSYLRISSTLSVEKYKNFKRSFAKWACFRNALFNIISNF